MKAEFTSLVQKLVSEQGQDTLFNTAKCKAFLADYSGSEYQSERRLLLQVVEAGITSGIANTNDLAGYKQVAAKKLQDDYYLAPNVASGVVDMLISVLRGESKEKTVCRNCGKELQDEWKPCPYCSSVAAQVPELAVVQQAAVQQAAPQAPPQQAAYQTPPYNPPVRDVGDKQLRHGFTSFWLWSNFIVSLLGVVGILYLEYFTGGEHEFTSFQFWTLLLTSVLSAYGLHRIIFEWAKGGFYWLVFVTIAATVFNTLDVLNGFINDSEISRLQCFISFAIPNALLYGVLHFRNAFNAKTTWEQLS
jgi:hypothetical protein